VYDAEGNLIRRKEYDPDGRLVSDRRFLVDTNNPTGYSQIVAETDGITGRVERFNTFADELKAQTVAATSHAAGVLGFD